MLKRFRSIKLPALFGCLLFAFAPPSQGAPGALDGAFTPPSISGSAYNQSLQPDGKILLGSLDGLQRLDQHGNPDPSFSCAVTGVYCTAVQKDGKILIGGSFTAVNGVSKGRIARLNSNGTLDTGFTATASSIVRSVAVQPDGDIVLAGSFTTVNGVTRNGVARVSAGGSLDTTFTPGAGGTVYALALQADGKVLIGGSLAMLTSPATARSIFRLNTDGSRDSGFSSDPSDIVTEILVEPGGDILIAGPFNFVDSTIRMRLAKVSSSGSLLAFDPSVNGVVRGLSKQVDGKILIGGFFNQVGGVSRTNVARVHNDGTLDTGFTPTVGDAFSNVFALSQQANGQILVSGDFYTVNGVTRPSIARLENDQPVNELIVTPTNITWNRGGSVPEVENVAFQASYDNGSTWTNLGAGSRSGTNWTLSGSNFGGIYRSLATSKSSSSEAGSLISQSAQIDPLQYEMNFPVFNESTNAIVYTTVVQPDGKVVMGGNFELALDYAANATVGQRYLARMDINGQLDTSFDPVLNGQVERIILQPDGKILISGSFSSVDGVSRSGGFARLNADGSLDTSFSITKNGTLYSIAVQTDGKILLGGTFTLINGTTRNRIARLNSDGTLDSSFDPDANNTVTQIVLQSDEQILVGGIFTTIGGGSRTRIARLDSSGSLDTGFTLGLVAPGFNPCITLRPDGMIYVVEPSSYTPKITRLFSDGSKDTSFVSYDHTVGGVFPVQEYLGLTLQADGRLLVSTKNLDNSTGPGLYLRRLNEDGSLDQNLTVPGYTYGTTLQKDGKILSYGFWWMYLGFSVQRDYNDTVATESLSMPSSTSIQWLRGGSAPEATRVTFDHSSDGGSTWTLLGLGQPVSGGWQISGLSPLTSGLIRARAHTVGGYYSNSSQSLVESVASITPELTLLGNATGITDGDTTPSSTDGTDYQSILLGGTSSVHSFTLRNDGLAPLTISSITKSGTHASEFGIGGLSLPFTLAAQSSVAFNVAFKPSGTGARTATITVNSDDSDEAAYDFAVQGTGVVPEIDITGNGISIADGDTTPSSTDHTDFGAPATAGATVTRTFTLANSGTGNLLVSSIGLTGTNASDFAVSGITLPATIASSGSSTFQVTFTPVVSGTRTATVTVYNNDTNEGFYDFAIQATSATEINVQGSSVTIVDGDASPSPADQTDFGFVQLSGSQAFASYAVQNTGTAPLYISAIGVSGTHSADFTVSGLTLPVVVPAGSSTGFTVTFDPSAGGTRNATVTITSDDADEASYDFAIRGVGKWNYTSSTDVPVTASSVTIGTEAIGFDLSYTPAVGTNLTVISNTGLDFISGAYSNLAHGQFIELTFGGVTYSFVADYWGGDGNDLVLHWAGTQPYGWGDNGEGSLGDSTVADKYSPVATVTSGVLAGKTVTHIATGGAHTLALTSDGKVYSWGQNASRQLGLGTTSVADSNVPVAVFDGSGSALNGRFAVAIAAGASYSLALLDNGTVATWGFNTNGQLGNGTTTVTGIPTLVQASAGTTLTNVVRIASGSNAYHTLALRHSAGTSTLVAWGRNTSRCLGTNSATAYFAYPVNVTVTGALTSKNIVGLSAGTDFSTVLCADTSDNVVDDVVTWGSNASGRLGNNSTTVSYVPVSASFGSLLTGGKTIKAISAGASHVLALRSDGFVISWGDNTTYGKLGINSTADSLVPVLVNTTSGTSTLFNKTVIAVSAGENHSYALCSDGSMHAWGRNNVGQMGQGSVTPSFKTVPDDVLTGALSGTQKHVATASGLSTGQTLVAGQQAFLQVEQPFSTALVDGLSSVNWGNVFFNTGVDGVSKTFAIRNVGTGTLTGLSVSKDGTHSSDYTVSSLGSTTLAANETTTFTVTLKPSAAGTRTAAIHVTGAALNSSLPFDIALTGVGIADSSTFTAAFASATDIPLSAASFTATGKTASFTVGFNPANVTELMVVNNTGLGFISGTFTGRAQGSTVTLTYGGVDYEFVINYFGGTGNDIVLASKNTRLFVWGLLRENTSSSEFISDQNNLPLPKKNLGVLAGKTVIDVAFGLYHAVALCSDGKVATWGFNDQSQLGQGATDSIEHPTPAWVDTSVSSALYGKTVIAISSGSYHTLALCSDGTLTAWGDGGGGRLGNNSTSVSNTPVAVDASASSALQGRTVVSISASDTFSLALCSDGNIASWGYGGTYALGQTGVTTALRPILVSQSLGTSLLAKAVIKVDTGYYCSVALCSDGTLHSWGSDANGELGNGVAGATAVPKTMDSSVSSALYGKFVIDVALDGWNGVALCSDGTLVSWGYSQSAGDNNPSFTDRHFPVLVSTASGVSALHGRTVSKIHVGNYTGMVLCTDGTLVSWGDNGNYVLGINVYGAGFPNSMIPLKVDTTAFTAFDRFTSLFRTAYGQAAAIVRGVNAPGIIVSTDSGMFERFFTQEEEEIRYYGNTPVTYNITNTGTLPLQSISISVAGSNPSSFVVDTTLTATTLAPGASTTFVVNIAPGTAVSGHNAIIRVNSNVTGSNSPFEFFVKYQP